MPRPARDGDWKPQTLTLSAEVRTKLRFKAAEVGWEPGKTADSLLDFALQHWDRPEDAQEAEALRKLFRLIEIRWDQDEFLEWLGTLILGAKNQVPDPPSARLEGAKEVIRWWRTLKVEPRWRLPIANHLRGVRGVRSPWLSAWSNPD